MDEKKIFDQELGACRLSDLDLLFYIGNSIAPFDYIVDLSQEESEFDDFFEEEEENGDLEFGCDVCDLESHPGLQVLFGVECPYYRECPFLGSVRSRKHYRCDEERQSNCPYFQERDEV
jgi:hypothetical protein